MKSLNDILAEPRWPSFYNWKKNPFRLKVGVDSSAFLLLKDVDRVIIENIETGDITNVVGSAGIGKTEHALQIQQTLSRKGYKTAYIDLSGTEMDIKSFARQLLSQIPLPWWKRRKKDAENIDTIVSHLCRCGQRHKIAILIDEAQNLTDPHVTDALRRISDSCKNTTIILFSLQELMSIPVFRESMRRRMKMVSMRTLELSEAHELIRKRLMAVGGDGIQPFAPEVINFIWQKAKRLPGTILRYCEEISTKNVSVSRLKEINLDNALSLLGERWRVAASISPRASVVEAKPPEKAPLEIKTEREVPPLSMQAKRVLEMLSPQQQKLLLFAKDHPAFTIEDIASEFDIDRHSITTQMRRINNKQRDIVFQPIKKVGKKKIWKLADNYKILFSSK